MLAKVAAPASLGIESRPIEIECDLSNSLPGMCVVGLGDKAVEESKERIKSAIKNSGLVLPPKRITLNLAPADLPKDGTAYDLGIAVAILAASGQVLDPADALFIGELALDGRVKKVPGVLSAIILAKELGYKDIIIPAEAATEASLIQGVRILPAASLSQVYRHLTGEEAIPALSQRPLNSVTNQAEVDLAEIYGQTQAKRALEIAAVGGHNLIFSGPPGVGKTLLAKASIGLLPTLTYDEMIEVTRIHSLAGLTGPVLKRPFRSPHHTASDIAIIGGGKYPRPGEISLSHRGVLFLDELPEFPRSVLEVLRQPLEDGSVTVARAAGSITFPAKFMLIATQNPCPCGYAGDQLHACTCSLTQINNYQKKISGPLMDRIDLVVDVQGVKRSELMNDTEAESTGVVAKRVKSAREFATSYRPSATKLNAELTPSEVKLYCQLDKPAEVLAAQAVEKLGLSARGYMKAIKVARSIADLAASQIICLEHLTEALGYRSRAQ